MGKSTSNDLIKLKGKGNIMKWKRIISIGVLLSIIIAVSGVMYNESTYQYMNRYNRIEKSFEKKYNNAFTQRDLNMTSMYELHKWNKELNRVIKKLKNSNNDKSQKLEKIKRKIKKEANKRVNNSISKNPNERGSMDILVSNMTGTHYIQKKIKWLIKKYGDVGDF